MQDKYKEMVNKESLTLAQLKELSSRVISPTFLCIRLWGTFKYPQTQATLKANLITISVVWNSASSYNENSSLRARVLLIFRRSEFYKCEWLERIPPQSWHLTWAWRKSGKLAGFHSSTARHRNPSSNLSLSSCAPAAPKYLQTILGALHDCSHHLLWEVSRLLWILMDMHYIWSLILIHPPPRPRDCHMIVFFSYLLPCSSISPMLDMY